jgi:hypothetical protein
LGWVLLPFLSPPLLHLKKLLSLLFPPMILAHIWGFERGDLDLHFHQTISSLSEGISWDLDLEVFGWLSPLFFLSNLILAFVALVGFECEGLEHLRCSCFASLHSVELSTTISSSERPWACYSWRVTS